MAQASVTVEEAPVMTEGGLVAGVPGPGTPGTVVTRSP
jgi:hypothetical protein